MNISIFLSLAAYACATTFSPGPNNVLLLSLAGQYGFKKCLPILRGIWLGLITVMLLCGFGCALIGELIPSIEKYARLVGAAYICWLGWQTLRRKPSNDEADTSQTPITTIHGFLLQFLNIKILMLGIAAYCSFIMALPWNPVTVIIFACTMAVAAACGNLIWTTAGSLLLPIYKKHYKIFNIIMAALLGWCVYKILFIK